MYRPQYSKRIREKVGGLHDRVKMQMLGEQSAEGNAHILHTVGLLNLGQTVVFLFILPLITFVVGILIGRCGSGGIDFARCPR